VNFYNIFHALFFWNLYHCADNGICATNKLLLKPPILILLNPGQCPKCKSPPSDRTGVLDVSDPMPRCSAFRSPRWQFGRWSRQGFSLQSKWTARRDYKLQTTGWMGIREPRLGDFDVYIADWRSRIRFCNVDGNLASTHARQPQVTALWITSCNVMCDKSVGEIADRSYLRVPTQQGARKKCILNKLNHVIRWYKNVQKLWVNYI